MSTAIAQRTNGWVEDLASRVVRLPAVAAGRAGSELQGVWVDARRAAGLAPESENRLSSDEVYAMWYLGLAAMAALGLIPWRLALLVAGIHTVERNVHDKRLDEFAEGIGAGV